jgi:hypothetical protein
MKRQPTFPHAIARAAFLERLRQASERTNLTPEEADKLTTDAVSAVRSESST